MRHFLIGVLIGAFLLPATLTAEENPRLVQRTVVYWALQSSVVLVQLLPTTPPRERAFCGGVVLQPDVMLTAAHCVRDGRKFFVRSYSGHTAHIKEMKLCIECDLGLVYLNTPLPDVRPAVLSQDIARGDTTYLIGAPDGDEFAVSRGVISKILPEQKFSNCEKAELTGTKTQQVLMTDAKTYFGNSGGGVWSDRAELIGILVRVSAATVGCLYGGEYLIFGLAVGPASLKTFLESGK